IVSLLHPQHGSAARGAIMWSFLMLRVSFQLSSPASRPWLLLCATAALAPTLGACAKQKTANNGASEWRLVRPAQPTVESFNVEKRTPRRPGHVPPPKTEADEQDQNSTDAVADGAHSPLNRTKRVAAGLVKSLRADWPNIQSCVRAAGHPVTRPDAVVTLRFSLHADGELADDRKIEASGWPAAALCIRDTL